MHKTFESIEEEIESFTDKELSFWNKGYLAAIYGLVGQIQDDKIRVLDKLVSIQGIDHKEKLKIVLEARLTVLDAYDEHYRNRAKKLEGESNVALL